MADSIRLQIIKEIEAVCLTVTAVKFVSRNLRDALSIPDYPAILIVPAGDEVTPLLNDAETIDWQIGLEAYVKTEGNLSDAYETFLADLKLKMALNRTLNGKVIDFHRESTTEAIPTDQNWTVASSFSLYRVIYREWRGDPYAAS